MTQYHPTIAGRGRDVGEVDGGRYRNWFGLWQLMTVNFPTGASSVKTKPHVDWKNPVAFFCAVTAFGTFGWMVQTTEHC